MRLRGKHKPATPAHGLRRSCHHHQCREGGADRQEARQEVFITTPFPGGIKDAPAALHPRRKIPERVVEKAVERMLDEGPLARQTIPAIYASTRVRTPHEAQNPEALEMSARSIRRTRGRLMPRPRKSLDAFRAGNPRRRKRQKYVQKLDKQGRATPPASADAWRAFG